MVFYFKALLALVAAFISQGLVRTGVHQAVGQRMLDAAGWTAGAEPPMRYMVTSVTAALVGAALAGVVAALIMGRARFRVALVFGILFATMGIMADRATLFTTPHAYQWPLVLAPIVAMPLGAWLIIRLRPLRRVSLEAPASG